MLILAKGEPHTILVTPIDIIPKDNLFANMNNKIFLNWIGQLFCHINKHVFSRNIILNKIKRIIVKILVLSIKKKN